MTTLITISCISFSFANASFQNAKVEKIILHDFGGIYLYLEGGTQTNEPCENKAAIYIAPSNQHYDKMYAAILAAYHSSTTVSGWVNGCHRGYPKLSRLDLMPKQ